IIARVDPARPEYAHRIGEWHDYEWDGRCPNARLIAAAPALAEALEKAVERMEAVAEGIPVHNRAKGVSQAAHVAHMAGHLAQHAKKARAALAAAGVKA
ncbi:unnamed protein product, partial [marine sediment metagenome]